jgi:hypothetical protein
MTESYRPPVGVHTKTDAIGGGDSLLFSIHWRNYVGGTDERRFTDALAAVESGGNV